MKGYSGVELCVKPLGKNSEKEGVAIGVALEVAVW